MASVSNASFADQSFVVATGNSGKRREFATLLEDLLDPSWTVYDRETFPQPLEEVEETGSTFEANAIKKAMETVRQTGCCALADDSGLIVDALGGAPGVRSARFAGEDASDDDNNQRLLQELEGVADKDRTARFVTVLCLALPDNGVARKILARRGLTRDEIPSAAPRNEATLVRVADLVVIWFRGHFEGTIAEEPAGENGFGYDPLFVIPGDDHTHMAQLCREEKNRISHRACATKKLLAFFEGP